MTNKKENKIEEDFYKELDEKGKFTSNISMNLIVFVIIAILIFAVCIVAMI